MAFTFSIYYVSITPAVSFFIPEDVVGTAWGVAGSAVGFSQCLIPLLVMAVLGSSTDLPRMYSHLSALGFGLSIIPLGFAMWINYFDDYDILDVRYADSDDHISNADKMKKSIATLSTNSD